MSSSITTWRSRRLALSLLVALVSCAGGQGGAGRRTAGDAPDFALRDLSGRTVRLSDHRGKVVLVNFWATWCVPCRVELPHLERLYKQYAGQGLVVLGVSIDGPESTAEVDPHARRYGLTFPVLLDQETRVVALYNPKKTAPFTVIIGRDGSVARRREGYHAGDEVRLEADIKTLLAARADE
ncbi:MAG TPA: TlpA disulfide reductase family protein [Kofleriaceae bacterium]|nr:TlpA disulfide reductase family protein [Kofleriaceae bacterium]